MTFRNFVILVIAPVFFIALISGSIWLSRDYGCRSRWSDSGLEAQWKPFKGCRVKMKDGRWLPEQALRAVQ